MTDKQPLNPKSNPSNTQVLCISFALLLFVLAFVAVYNPKLALALFGLGVLFCFLFGLFLEMYQAHRISRVQRANEREHRRHIAKRKALKNLEAQLDKPDFEDRLRAFTNDTSEGTDEEPVSKMEFWELNENYSRTPPRPISLIRYLLQRISKLVGQLK